MAFGGAAGTILSIAEYNLAGQLIGAILGPYSQAITNEVMSITPLVPLSPADLALAVIRNEIPEDAAAGEAAMSGINAGRFHTLTRLTGDAPAPEELAVALRRGFIDAGRYLEGIRQGRLRDEWGDLVRQLATQDPSPTTPLLAELKAQADHATALELYEKFGGNPDHYDLALAVEGAGPSPLEAAEMARRGIIPWAGLGEGVVSFEQAVHESAYRNKWQAGFRAISEYLPPPRTVTAMIREGALTPDQGRALFEKAGLPPELVTAYLDAASQQKTAPHKELAEGTISQLYHDRLMSHDQAVAALEALSFTAEEAGFILSIQDVKVAQHYLELAISRVHTLYVGHKIGKATALSTLGSLGVDATGAADLMGIWDWEAAANVRAVTAAELAAAYHAAILTQDEATAELVGMGYTPFDAWLILSVHEKKALPGKPPPDTIGPGPL